MLEELDIRNLGPIREATIAPAAGMTAITGETGAGKSMLLSAIRLVSGGAAESSRVSAGADEAWAQAIFALSDDAVASEHSGDTNDAGSGDADSGFTGAAAAVAKAHDAGVDPEDGELFLSRTVRASGRSRAVLGGKSVPRSVLGAIAGELVTIHGQTDQLKIAAPHGNASFWTGWPETKPNWPPTARRGMRWPPWMSGWNACARRNPLPANRPTTCANPSTASTESTRSRGRMRS